MKEIAHIINPVKAGVSSDLFIAQPITFETMRMAKERAQKMVGVDQYAAFFPEDEEMVPDYFKKTKLLDRSIQDIGDFGTEKKLPLINDILDRLYEASKADYFIYTNVDIALMPDFYIRVKEIIQNDHDGFVINRRTISDKHSELKEIPLMYEETAKGEKHPGYDCFIFPRKAYKKYRLGNSCIGANWIGRIIICNIAAFSERFHIYKDLHLTFHIGDERIWLDKRWSALAQHNEDELIRISKALLNTESVSQRELLKEFHVYHMKKSFYQGRPADIIRHNSPEHRLRSKSDDLYPSSLITGSSPEKHEPQIIRQNPIFIIGYPRSGTTFAQSLIATQKKIVSLYETHFFSRVWKFIQTKDNKITPGCLDEVIKTIRTCISFSKNAETHIKKIIETACLSPKMLFETVIIDNIINKIPIKDLNTVRWMEKTPHHTFHLDKIFSLYPQAKVVYIMREPEGAIISRRNNFFFSNEHLWPIQRHVQQWMNGVSHFERFKQQKPDSLISVRIEDLTEDTVAVMQHICHFLNIDFDRSRLNNYKEMAKSLIHPWEVWKTSAYTGDYSANSANKGERLSPAEQFELWKMAGKKMEEYGYSLCPPPVSRKDVFLSRMRSSFLLFQICKRRAARILPRSVKRNLKKIYFIFNRN